MVEVHILDTSGVLLGSQSVTGPARVFSDSCTVGSQQFTRGYVVVNAGAGVQQLPFTVQQVEFLPFAVCLVFILGLLWARFGLSR